MGFALKLYFAVSFVYLDVSYMYSVICSGIRRDTSGYVGIQSKCILKLPYNMYLPYTYPTTNAYSWMYLDTCGINVEYNGIQQDTTGYCCRLLYPGVSRHNASFWRAGACPQAHPPLGQAEELLASPAVPSSLAAPPLS